jgi:hypothetical protein
MLWLSQLPCKTDARCGRLSASRAALAATPKTLFAGTKNVSGSIQNQHVHVLLAIIHQSDVYYASTAPFGEPTFSKLAKTGTRCPTTAVEIPDAGAVVVVVAEMARQRVPNHAESRKNDPDAYDRHSSPPPRHQKRNVAFRARLSFFRMSGLQ